MNSPFKNIFMSEKKLSALYKQQQGIEQGVYLEKLDTNNGKVRRLPDRLLTCILRSLLIFMASFGTIGGVISAFELPYNPYFVIPAFIIISVVISMIYYNRLLFYLGYFLIFFIFAFLTFSYYWYINSGFQAFLNTLYGQYSDYFLMSSLREGTEIITNRTLTISITMIYVGTFLAILLNITISGYMNLLETFLVTFPILQLALYIELKPGSPYLILLIAAYITVGILGRSSHYKLPTIKKPKDNYITIRKKKRDYHSYLSCGMGMLRLTIQSIVITAVLIVVFLGSFYRSFSAEFVRNKLKSTTDEYVKLFVQNGIMGFFDRYPSTGGLGKGKLGGVSQVRPDYQTDLRVTYVPYSSDTIYLKAFVGGDYVGNAFAADEDPNYLFDGVYSQRSMYALSDYTHPSFDYAKMQVENLDADYTYNYMPYDTVVANTVNGLEYKYDKYDYIGDRYFSSKYPSNSDGVVTYELVYDPFIPSDSYELSSHISAKYTDYVYDRYTDFPGYLTPGLDSICDDAGLTAMKNEYERKYTYGDYSKEATKYRLEMLDTLYTYFLDNYDYTMAPGTTPYNNDAVIYFLTQQKRGFCAHFASSATLLLRDLGIPARYVEGYVLTSSEMANSEAISPDTSGWISSKDFIEFDDTGVVTASITDANAHAWVEVFIDGYGWIPYEFTPPDFNSGSDDDFAFGDIFTGLFQTNTGGIDVLGNTTINYTFNFDASFGFILRPLLMVVCGVIIIAILIVLINPLIRLIMIWHYTRKHAYDKAVTISYKALVKKLYRKKYISSRNMLVEKVFDQVLYSETKTKKKSADKLTKLRTNILNKYDAEVITACIEVITRSIYSNRNISKEEYKKCSLFIASCK